MIVHRLRCCNYQYHYEVVYSRIIDNLVNTAGASVSKIVNLPYDIVDPADGSTVISSAYPNSLVNMRDQVIDVVGQVSAKLPLWMTSAQSNGQVLGFTPAWVICYTKPNRSGQIAYYLQTQFGQQLNRVDFKVDRYVLDRTLSRNWDTVTQDWTPTPSLTTFDRFESGQFPFIGFVDIATQLAFADVNQRTLSYIADLGGLDGQLNNLFSLEIRNCSTGGSTVNLPFVFSPHGSTPPSLKNWISERYPFIDLTINLRPFSNLSLPLVSNLSMMTTSLEKLTQVTTTN